MQKILHRYPITFTKRNEYSTVDARFIEVVIDVMHTGKNKNNSSFEKQVIENAIPSIKNTPILGYVTINDDNEKDFKGHEHTFRKDADGLRYVYAGSAYGVIPESCNPRWVLKDDGTGVEREYLRVDGLLWTKFDDPVDIFTRDIEKGHSVELWDMRGEKDNAGTYNVSKFLFDGCCILSTTDPRILPAMTGSNITACFSADDISAEIKQRLNEYCTIKQENEDESTLEGDATMDMDKIQEPAVEEVVVDASEPAEPVEEPIVESEPAVEDEPIADEPATEFTVEAVEDEPAAEPVPVEYTLTVYELMDELRRELLKENYIDAWGYEVYRYWLNDVQDGEAIVYDSREDKTYGIPYAMDGDNVVLNYEEKKRKKIVYADWEEGAAEPEKSSTAEIMEALATNFKADLDVANEKAAQLDEIKPQYDAYVAAEKEATAAALQAKRDALFAKMDERLSENEEYAALKANTEMDYSELEDKCYALFGRMSAEFSYVPAAPAAEPEVQNARFGVSGSPAGAESKYGNLFERYGARK